MSKQDPKERVKKKRMITPAMSVKRIVNGPRELMLIPVARFWMAQPCFWKVIFDHGKHFLLIPNWLR